MKANASKSNAPSARAAAVRDGGNASAGKSLPAVGGVTQLYSMSANKKLKTQVESQNGNYFLKKERGNPSLYGNPKNGIPRYCDEANDNVSGTGISRYEPKDKFYADCLHTAEEIMNNMRLKQNHVNSKEKSTGESFGEGIQKNWRVVKGVDGMNSDENADPGVGEAFATVGQNRSSFVGSILCQYHAAAVVATDGTDRITMEVFGNPDKENRVADAKFSIYDTDINSGNTFHDVWASSFKNGITVALEAI